MGGLSWGAGGVSQVSTSRAGRGHAGYGYAWPLPVRWGPRATPGPGRTRRPALGQEHRQSSEGLAVGSVIKKRRKRMAKKKHRKLLKKTRVQRRNKK